MHADLLLIDETLGRKAAAARGIHITGTIGILEQAADYGLLGLEEAFAKIKNTDFWIARTPGPSSQTPSGAQEGSPKV